MALKKTIIDITAAGRDFGKRFHITEMPARQVERWERRALACMVQTGVEIPDDAHQRGFGFILATGLKALLGMTGNEVEALHDELMSCISITPEPKIAPEVIRPLLVDSDIEEVATILQLKDEVIKLHTGFSIASFVTKAWKEASATAAAMPNTPISAENSEQ